MTINATIVTALIKSIPSQGDPLPGLGDGETLSFAEDGGSFSLRF